VVRTRLEALAAPDRLQICRAVASEPRTAGEIAALWGLNSTQVTRHLRALTRAGLVTAERQGRFVAYRLDEQVMRALGTDLLDLVMR
jgi:DNA-binding transcriptional ArsR family regulator